VAASQSLAVRIVAGGEDASTIRGKGDGIDPIRMSLEGERLPARGGIPDSGSPVPTSRDDAFAIRGEGNGADMERMSGEGEQRVACHGIPDSGGIWSSLPGEGCACHPGEKATESDITGMSLEREDLLTGGSIPDLSRCCPQCR